VTGLDEASSHWALGVKDRVMTLLKQMEGAGRAVGGKKLESFAGRVQAEMAGHDAGHGSKLYLALVEAVAFGYPLQSVEGLLDAEARRRDPATRVSIKDSVRDLIPAPRDWLAEHVPESSRFFDLTLRAADALVRP
jgi:hypothetical protein